MLDKQLEVGLSNLNSLANISIAYEPVWAIGTGESATGEQVQEVHAYIRRYLGRRFDRDTATQTRILYGGSAKPTNIAELMSKPDVDGALVGGASLKAGDFSQMYTTIRDLL